MKQMMTKSSQKSPSSVGSKKKKIGKERQNISDSLKILVEKTKSSSSQTNRSLEKKRLGVIVSNKAEKTIVVAVERRFQHAKYSKTLIQTKRYLAHDSLNQCKIGDLVIIQECRPLSKKKCWVLKEIVKSYEELIF